MASFNDRIKAHRSAADVYDAPAFESMAERIAELEDKLNFVDEVLSREIKRVQKIRNEHKPPNKVDLLYVQEEYKLILEEIKGGRQWKLGTK